MLTTTIQDEILIAMFSDGATNAITQDTLKCLQDAVERVNRTPEIKGMILTGQGRFFPAGSACPCSSGLTPVTL